MLLEKKLYGEEVPHSCNKHKIFGIGGTSYLITEIVDSTFEKNVAGEQTLQITHFSKFCSINFW